MTTDPDAARCAGKVRHESRAEADTVIRRQKTRLRTGNRDRHGKPVGEPQHAYKCRTCGGWHVGSQRWQTDGVRTAVEMGLVR